MKFQVSGSNKQTGGRMTLELEADSKAAAERKAFQSGMNVNHVEAVGHEDIEDALAKRARGKGGSGSMGKILLLLVLVAVAAAYWFFFMKH